MLIGWAAGHPERYPEFAAEFVRLNAAVLVTSINDGVIALKRIPETEGVAAAAKLRGIEVMPLAVSKLDDVTSAISSIKGNVDAPYVIIHPFISVNQVAINALVLEARLPTMHGLPEHVRSGGLMSYGASLEDLFARVGDYVDKILRGAKPANLPIEQPIKFDLVINLKTATRLGLAIPPALLTTADEVIE